MNVVGQIRNESILKRWKGIKRNVVLTEERIAHIREGHSRDYSLYHAYIPEAIENPDYVIEDADKESTVMLVKHIEGTGINVIVVLAYENGDSSIESSVLTMYRIGTKRLRRLLRNNPVLYNSGEI